MESDQPDLIYCKCPVCADPAKIHATNVVEGRVKEVHLCERHAGMVEAGHVVLDHKVAAYDLYWAAASLRSLRNAQCVPTLIDSLDNTQADIRYFAAFILGRIGCDAKHALPLLRDLLRDEDDAVRNVASWAITSIDPNGGRPTKPGRKVRFTDRLRSLFGGR